MTSGRSADAAPATSEVAAAKPAAVAPASEHTEIKDVKLVADPAIPAPPVKPLYPEDDKNDPNYLVDNDPPKTVRLIGMLTEVGAKLSWMTPNIPVPPFRGWHQFITDHKISVHCALEWKDDRGKWFHAEMRSSRWDRGSTEHRVGLGQFPTTGYIAYGVFITPGRYRRAIDLLGRPVEITIDAVVDHCDYKKLEAEIRKYGAFGKSSGDRGTGGYGRENVGLGGPAYKPGQNSNTMVHYVLLKAGATVAAPDMAVGWDTIPTFPYSTDTRYPKYNE